LASAGPAAVGPALALSATAARVRAASGYAHRRIPKSGPQADDKAAALIEHCAMSTSAVPAAALTVAGVLGLGARGDDGSAPGRAAAVGAPASATALQALTAAV
jgi:hypothetical protein